MKAVGIIAEYNPFHNGHKYQIDYIRKNAQADFIIVAMSGNFVQRGMPALMDKYARARLALSSGADLVLELPTIWATASAELFALGGVNLLKSTGVVNQLCFGAETSDLSRLSEIAKAYDSEDESFLNRLDENLRSGMSYPAARMKALNLENYDEINKPNNILAIEYIRALQDSSIEPLLIQRQGDGYSQEAVSSNLASATAIRRLLSEGDFKALEQLTPSYQQIMDYHRDHGLVFEQHISTQLHYKLLSERDYGFCKYADCSESLSSRIVKLLPQYRDFNQFCQLLKTRDVTYSRVSRVLLHILLGITTNDYYQALMLPKANYLRILGFRRDATDLLRAIKKEAAAPLITKVADASCDSFVFKTDLFASDVYGALIASNGKNLIKNDFSHELVIM